MAEWLVYWLYDDTCTHRARHGFIGVTKKSRLYVRMNQHKHSKLVPKDFRYRILFRGSRKDALAYELQLRPSHHIGWNVTIGGFPDGRGGRGLSKSPEHREKIRQAALARWSDPDTRAEHSRTVKKAFETIDRSGANNSRFGKPMSEEAKQKVRDTIAAKGGRAGERNANYRHGAYTGKA